MDSTCKMKDNPNPHCAHTLQTQCLNLVLLLLTRPQTHCFLRGSLLSFQQARTARKLFLKKEERLFLHTYQHTAVVVVTTNATTIAVAGTVIPFQSLFNFSVASMAYVQPLLEDINGKFYNLTLAHEVLPRMRRIPPSIFLAYQWLHQHLSYQNNSALYHNACLQQTFIYLKAIIKYLISNKIR